MLGIVSVLTLGGLGLIFGVGLSLANKKFYVRRDSLAEEILVFLPQANCGACGKLGCLGFAESLAKKEISLNRCVLADKQTREKLASLLGLQLEEKTKKVAVLFCNGGNIRAKDKFIYQGTKSCSLASSFFGGQKSCFWACLGFGDCEKICPFGAITMSEEALPIIDEEKCTGCGLCVERCPKKVLTLVPKDKVYNVRCSSKEIGKKVLEACSVGCIACRRCQKACNFEAIKIIDNLAVINYERCTLCGECIK
ncbi:MAG: RnfABCDGE type electron transport complex subunit B, partial [Candidatus Omnitrophica bacterium]|nr:RnfABCDGE type electron transport complex subunit B [Candidatus Omnitrophota bacterium]